MFCTFCAAPVTPGATECASCGRSIPWAIREHGSANNPPAPQEKPSRIGRTATMLLPFIVALLVAFWFGWNIVDSRSNEARAYALAETSLAAGNYPEAIRYFTEAGSYRDATERRATTQQLLAPVRSAYLDALSAIERNDHEVAIALLEPIAETMPAYEQVGVLLEQAREGLLRSLERQVAIAVARRNWMSADHVLEELVALEPGNQEYAQELADLRRQHGPIIFVRSGRLLEVGPGGADERVLFDDFAIASARWSPDRRFITFLNDESSRSQSASLYLFDYGSETVTLISDSASPDPLLSWNPAGTKFAFVSNASGNDVESGNRTYLSVYDLATGGIEQIVAPPLEPGASDSSVTNVTSPAWSPDGSALAYVAIRSPLSGGSALNAASSDIYITEVSSGDTRNLTNGALPSISYATWSPTANQILTWEARGGTAWFVSFETAIHLIDVDSGEVARLTARTDTTGWPSWSPDGQTFAIVENGMDVIVRTLDGTVVASASSSWELSGVISWSPALGALIAIAEQPQEPS
ncbi:MAG: hypothetical protein AB7V46_18185, partial [Thermomicrobiales bacterium]